ncbi:ABC transporter [Sulfuricaulis limicola]|uniref:Transport permease protein n=1 Tax=Sulfuricaulis limicola TaxID=1620215 RepID=A0A1B4XH71_9GAMM|nr:ABC transporter permease [Sulfuricaulis limicola]BAV34152.1 ABC transporter [Sulfuricaulis limicola]
MSVIARAHTGFVPSLRRVYALVLRHTYLLRSSGPRILELVYWPTVQMILWGFITVFLVNHSSWIAQASGVLLSGVLLWDVLFRGQLGVSLVFMEEMWSRNLGHLFVSPLRPFELGCALLTMSLIRTLIGVGGAALIAIPLFDFSVFSLGLPLLAFFINLIVMGWAIGLLVSGIVLRYGLGAESMAWIAIFAVQPISGVYYPIATLPEWLQYVAAILPSSHVFEGMRSVLFDHVFRADLLLHAVLLNVVYLTAGFAAFLAFFKVARVRGQLLHVGE